MLDRFENLARTVVQVGYGESSMAPIVHPFDSRDIHPCFPAHVRELFDNGHYAQATFEAFKFVDKQVAKLSSRNESGKKLMMTAFSEEAPLIKLTTCLSTSEKDEQEGYKFLFAGSMIAIRNPRGHEYDIHDSPGECLDHLALASILLRRLQQAGFEIKVKSKQEIK